MSSSGRLPEPPSAFFTPLLGSYFHTFGIRAAVWWKKKDDGRWLMLHDTHQTVDALAFERRFERELARSTYNERMARRAEREGRAIFGMHNGLADLWVPIKAGRTVFAFLVAGPFFLTPPDSRDLVRGYQRLSGKPPRPDDSTFASYVRAMLDTTVVDPLSQREMLQFGSAFARLMMQPGADAVRFEELRKIAARAWQRRPNQLMWDTARGLVDDFENPTILSYHGRSSTLPALGISRPGNEVLAALPVQSGQIVEQVEAQVRGCRFQYDCAALARKIPNAILGRLGDDGVFLIVSTPSRPGASTRRAHLRAIADRLRRLASQRKLEIAVGVGGRGVSATELPHRYAEVLVALEWAMHARQPMVFFEDFATDLAARPGFGLYTLLRDLGTAFERRESRAVDVALERLIREVLRRAAGDVAAARGYFETVLGELLSVFERRGIVDGRAVADLSHKLGADVTAAKVPTELSRVFEHNVRLLMRVAVDPGKADRTTRLDNARAFLDRSFAEPLTLARIAKRAGMSPGHFSKAFKKQSGVGVERYLLDRRLQRARTLLQSTELTAARLAAECGFSSYIHFARALKRVRGTTAGQLRVATRDSARKPSSPADR